MAGYREKPLVETVLRMLTVTTILTLMTWAHGAVGPRQDSIVIKVRAITEEYERQVEGMQSLICEQAKIIEEYNKTVEDIKAIIETDVSFTVRTSESLTVAPGEIVDFSDIITNIGNGYDPTTDKFTAPYNGTYELTIILMTPSGSGGAYLHLKDQSGMVCSSFGTGSYQTGTCTVILELEAGHEMWVAVPDWMGSAVTLNQHYNYFSGHLIKRYL